MGVPKPLVKVGLGCLIVTLICAGVLGFWAWRILGGTVKPTTDYAAEINALVESYQKDAAGEPNAWNELQKVMDRSRNLHQMARANRKGEFTNIAPDLSVLRRDTGTGDRRNGSKPEEIRDAMALLKELQVQGVFADLDRLSRRGHIVRPLHAGNAMLISTLAMDSSDVLHLSRANTARYHTAVISGDYAEATSAFESGLVLARIHMQQGMLIDRLVGMGFMSSSISTMLETVHEIRDTETLRSLMTILDRQTVVPPLTLSIEVEHRLILDLIQWTFTDIGDQNGYLTPEHASMFQALPAGQTSVGRKYLNMLTVDRKEVTSALRQYMEQLIAYTHLSHPERVVSDFQPEAEAESLSSRHAILKPLLTSLGRSFNGEGQIHLEVAGARTVLAVEIWRREHQGQPPDQLSQLVPRILSKLPIDPISGKTFGLKRSDNQSSFGLAKSYVIYSFAGDGVDDGGNEAITDQQANASRYALLMQIPVPRGFDFVVYPVKPQNP